MNKSLNYSVFIDSLFRQASEKGTPLSGSFELTSRCTLNCKMCYIHRSPNSKEAIAEEKSAEWWIDLAQRAANKGMLLLLLTGGEPLIRKDFEEIYLACRNMGLLVSVNTNGTLIDDSKVEFFSKNPPQRLNISLYGTSPETYEKLCGDGDAFNKVITTIKKLKEAGVGLKLNYTITPYNQADALKAYDLAKELELPIQPVSYMFPPLRSSCQAETVRLSAEEAAHAHFNWQKHHFSDPKDLRLFLEATKKGESPQKNNDDCFDSCGERINCRAGSSTFWVTYDGRMTPCGMMVEPNIPIEDFDTAWSFIRSEREKIFLPAECKTCSLRKSCDICAAVSYAETGRFDGVPSYVCEKARIYHKLCKDVLLE